MDLPRKNQVPFHLSATSFELAIASAAALDHLLNHVAAFSVS